MTGHGAVVGTTARGRPAACASWAPDPNEEFRGHHNEEFRGHHNEEFRGHHNEEFRGHHNEEFRGHRTYLVPTEAARQKVSLARPPKWMGAGAGTRLTVSGRGGPCGWVAELSMVSPELGGGVGQGAVQ
jgi:hypothetical protein